jgi:hypothetical protein
MRAEIDGDTEQRCVGHAAPADAAARFEHRNTRLCGTKAPRGGNSGRAGSDYDGINIEVFGPRAQRRRREQRGSTG